MKKIFKSFVVLCSFFIFSYNVNATTLKDLYNELNGLENAYKQIQNKKNLSQRELSNLNASIISTEAEISRAQNEISQAENEIITSENEIEEKKDETNQMLLYLQLMNSKGDSMLEYIMDADSYTDFIYRSAVVSQMSEYNQEIITELNSLIDNLNNKKAQLSEKQKELTKKKSDLSAKYALVQSQYKEEHADGLDLADQIANKRKRIKHYENLGCRMNDNINNCNGTPAVDGWVYPLNSFRQTSIYAEVRGSVKHYAVDLATGEGSVVKAVANGEVISAGPTSTKKSCYSEYMRKSYTNCHCGGVVIQIQHNYKGANYVSLYMHLLTYSVKVGDKVTEGQVIGTSGGGPIEADKWHDHCTAGAHLHFAMANGTSIGYSSEKGSTFDPVRFFPAMKGYGSRYGL